MNKKNTKLRQLRVTCGGEATIPASAVLDLQGGLKRRTDNHMATLIRSIETYGFSFPLFLWRDGEKNHCLDGHGRLAALREMARRGWDIPDLPVVWVAARNIEEAKNKLLRINSTYGDVELDAFIEFTQGLDFDMNDISINGISADALNIPDIGMVDYHDREDTRGSRYAVSKSNAVVSIYRISELVDIHIATKVVELIEARYSSDRRIEQFFIQCLKSII